MTSGEVRNHPGIEYPGYQTAMKDFQRAVNALAQNSTHTYKLKGQQKYILYI